MDRGYKYLKSRLCVSSIFQILMRFSIQMLGEEGVVQVKQAQRESFRMIVMPNYRPGTRSQKVSFSQYQSIALPISSTQIAVW